MAWLYMKQYDYPLRVMHNFTLDADEAHRFADFLLYKLDKSPESVAGMEELSKVRQSTIPYGAMLMERLVRRIEPSSIITSAYGVREGLLYSLLKPKERRRDPLIAACEDLADMLSRNPRYVRELRRWTDRLFGERGPSESADERRLRHAACLLSDIGWRAHPDYRGAQTIDYVTYASFAGIDHPGRAFLALAMFYRHAGIREEPNSELARLAGKRAHRRARIIGAACRLAAMVSAALPGLMEDTPIFLDGKGWLELDLSDRYSVLDGERLQKRLGALASLLDCEPRIRLQPKKRK
jgi:exopolyphosphatase/guanosine-5'-triphosphate,3'-diphosphate pyrophosphatase